MVAVLDRPVVKTKVRTHVQREHFTVLGYYADPVVTPLPLPGGKARRPKKPAAERRFLLVQGGGIKGAMWQELERLQAEGRAKIDVRGHTWYVKIYTDKPSAVARRYKFMTGHLPQVKQVA